MGFNSRKKIKPAVFSSLFRKSHFKSQFSLWLRSVAFGVALIFSWDTVVWSQPNVSLGIPKHQAVEHGVAISSLYDLTIPDSIGTIQQKFLPTSPNQSQPFVIHIQDAHAHPEAQRNIQAIFEYLAEEKRIAKVALEGAFGEIDPKILNLLPVEEVNEAMAEYLVGMGELTGAELFGRKHESVGIGFYGVDDQALYARSFELFQKIKSSERELKRALDFYHQAFERLEFKVLNEKLRTYVQKRRLWNKQRDELLPYLEVLRNLSKELLNLDLSRPRHQFEWPNLTRVVKAREVEVRLSLDQARSERAGLLEEIERKLKAGKKRAFFEDGLRYLIEDSSRGSGTVPDSGKPFESWLSTNRLFPNVKSLRHFFEELYAETKKHDIALSNYPNLLTFAGLLIVREEIDATALFKEVSALEIKLEEKLIRNDQEKVFLLLEKDFLLVERLLELGLTRGEFKIYNQRKDEFASRLFQSRLKRFVPKKLKVPTLPEETVRMAEKFYTLSQKRDHVLLQNTLNLSLAPYPLSPSKAIVLITGGFHSEGITSLLREKEIPHLVISPQMSHFEDSSLYEEVMLGKNSNLSRLARETSSLVKLLFSERPNEEQAVLMLRALKEKGVKKLQTELHLNPSQIYEMLSKSLAKSRIFDRATVLFSESDPKHPSIQVQIPFASELREIPILGVPARSEARANAVRRLQNESQRLKRGSASNTNRKLVVAIGRGAMGVGEGILEQVQRLKRSGTHSRAETRNAAGARKDDLNQVIGNLGSQDPEVRNAAAEWLAQIPNNPRARFYYHLYLAASSLGTPKIKVVEGQLGLAAQVQDAETFAHEAMKHKNQTIRDLARTLAVVLDSIPRSDSPSRSEGRIRPASQAEARFLDGQAPNPLLEVALLGDEASAGKVYS
ncbi:MAG: hypothetical protein HYS55_00480, partial [Candidatus Omnitrophica bacterium]|nr:hypothetical protein [Candidatus Omnitrophota bacterium]